MPTKKTSTASVSTDIISAIPLRLKKFLSRKTVKSSFEKKWPLALATAVLVSFFVSPNLHLLTRQFKAGDYTERAIKAPRTLYVEDLKSTKAREEESARSMPPVFDCDSREGDRQKEVAAGAFDRMRTVLGLKTEEGDDKEAPQASLIVKAEMARAEEAFASALGVSNLDKSDFNYLARAGYPDAILEEINRILSLAESKRIVSDLPTFEALVQSMPLVSRAVVVRDAPTGKETTLSDTDAVIDLPLFQREIRNAVKQTGLKERKSAQIAAEIALNLVKPNLAMNMAETEKRRLQAREAVVPSMVKYVKNQVIVGEGEKITEDKLAVLEQIANRQGGANQILSVISTAVLCFLMLAVLHVYGERNVRKYKLGQRDLLFLCFAAIFTTFMIRLGLGVASTIADASGFLPQAALMYALPIVASAMIVRIVLNSEIAAFYSIFLAALSGLIVGGNHGYMLFVLIGSLAGASMMRHASKRTQIIRGGLYTGLLNMAAVGCLTGFSGLGEELLTADTLLNMGGALIGGALSGPFALAFLPLMEGIFGYTSDVTLLELASLNHPLLKEMVVRAPGTYNHSVLVSTLAEAGGESIHANPLLAKVAALYHDVGKINKPQYFLENIGGGEDPHSNLYPSMSILILMAHVREGVDLARKNRLGDRIANIIRQHHGTSVIRTFYDRARAIEDPDRSPVKESDFRYPGPKPQTREAALVMLANIVEASCRKLKNPTPARLEGHLESVFNQVFLDGQLSECDLSLRDLGQVLTAFMKVIAGYYHSRLEYPEESPKPEPGERNLTLVNGSHPR